MTEKEYLSILNQIALNYDAEYVNECHDDFCISMRKNIKQLENLIKEHFDNPPLKFEELKKGMWVWDNKYEWYFECEPAISTDMAQCVTYNAFWYNVGEDEDEFFEEYEEFEENRFYRKQVQDE